MKARRAAWAGALAGAVALAGGAAPAAGQIGALAAAAAVAGGTQVEGDYALAGAPVFAESGLVIGQGWAAGAFAASTQYTLPFDALSGGQFPDVTLTSTGLALSGFVAVGEAAMIGASVQPYVEATADDGFESIDESGTGSLSLFAKAAVHKSDNGRMQLAATGRAGIPLEGDGSKEFFGGLGASYQAAQRTSVHGGVGVLVSTSPQDGVDGTTGLGVNGAVVHQVSPRAWLSGEVLGYVGDVWDVTIAPAARFKASEQVFIDVGAAIGGLHSDESIPLDFGFAVGATYVPGR